MKNLHTVWISGADRNLGLAMTEDFLKKGFYVFAGQYRQELGALDALKRVYPDGLSVLPLDVSDDTSVEACARQIATQCDHLDLLVHNAAVFGSFTPGDIRKGQLDTSTFMAPFNVNALGAVRLVQACLPLMQSGMKRLCFISSEAGSIGVAHREEISSYCMSKAALNMAVRLMANTLRPQGFTFRLYHPGWLRIHTSEDPNPPGLFEPWESAPCAVASFLEDRAYEDALMVVDNEGSVWPF